MHSVFSLQKVSVKHEAMSVFFWLAVAIKEPKKKTNINSDMRNLLKWETITHANYTALRT